MHRDKVGPTLLADDSALSDVYVFPCSTAQKGFWVLDHLQPGNPACNVAVRFKLVGKLVPTLLEASFNEIVRRHESLRTCFRIKDDEPVQVVEPSLSLCVALTDLRHLPQPLRSAEAERQASEEAVKPFSMRQAPLIRASLLQLENEEHLLLVTVHHAVADGWSIGVITEELAVIYEAYAKDEASPLPDLALQYGDYAVWEQRRLLEGEFDAQLAFWKDRLKDIVPLSLPTDYTRPSTRTFKAEIQSVLLPRKLTDLLLEKSQRNGCTLYITLLSAFKIVLARWSGSTDVTVGTLVAGRNEVQLENQIGTFVNSLVLRTDLAGNPSFEETLQRVKATVLDALANQDVPFEKVIAATPLRRDHRIHPLFQVNTIYQKDFVKPCEFSGIRLTPLPSKPAGAIYDINFFVVERADGWRSSIEFNAALYRVSTITDLLKRFQLVLGEFTANTDTPPAEFAAESERQAPAVSAPKSTRPQNSTRREIETHLSRIWCDALQVKRVDREADFFEAGGHSLLALSLLARIERELGPKISIARFFEASSIALMAAEIERAEDTQRLVTVSSMRSDGAKPPLFLVHGIGGTVLALGVMVSHLPHDRPVYAVQSPPLSAAPPPGSLEEMAARYIEEIRTVQPEGPYHFLGHSLGGLIAFEMAQQLYRSGQPVAFLGMLDTFQLGYWEHASKPLRKRLSRLVKDLRLHVDSLINGPDPLRYLLHRVRSKAASFLARFPGKSRAVWANKFSSIDTVNFIAARRYKAHPYPGSIVLLRATQRDDEGFDYLLGWGGLGHAGIEVVDIPGSHYTMSQEPNAQALAATVHFCLEKAAFTQSLGTPAFLSDSKSLSNRG